MNENTNNNQEQNLESVNTVPKVESIANPPIQPVPVIQNQENQDTPSETIATSNEVQPIVSSNGNQNQPLPNQTEGQIESQSTQSMATAQNQKTPIQVSNPTPAVEQTSAGRIPVAPPSTSANVNPILKETNKVSFKEKQPETVEVSSASPMENKKEKKKTKSKIPLIIFFIFLFAFIIFLPNINDYFKEQEGKKKIEQFDQQLKDEEEKQRKEEEEAKKREEEQRKEEEQYKTLTCTLAPVEDLNKTITTTQELTYANDKIKSVVITKETTYQSLDEEYTYNKSLCEDKTIAAA